MVFRAVAEHHWFLGRSGLKQAKLGHIVSCFNMFLSLNGRFGRPPLGPLLDPIWGCLPRGLARVWGCPSFRWCFSHFFLFRSGFWGVFFVIGV